MVNKNVKPNTVCRNKNCRKLFFACKTCVGQNQWRAIACSFECYNEYTEQVMKARSLGETVSLLPERLDMTEQEVVEFQKKDPDEIKDEALTELIDLGYSEELESVGVHETVKMINEDIDNSSNEYKPKKKKNKSSNNEE